MTSQEPQLERWKTEETRVVLDKSPWLVVEEHTVDIPNGPVIGDWAWCKTPSYVNVIGVTRQKTLGKEEDVSESKEAFANDPEAWRWIMFHQTKYAVGYSLDKDQVLAPVGGYIEANEDPLDAAKREFLEETGFVADTWVRLGSSVADANRGSGVGHLFLAVDARYRGVREEEEDPDLEEQVPVLLSTEEVEEALLTDGALGVQSWLVTVSLSLLLLRKRYRELKRSEG